MAPKTTKTTRTSKSTSRGKSVDSKGINRTRKNINSRAAAPAKTLQKRMDELQMLHETHLRISALRDPRKIGDALVDILTKRMNWHHITIREYDAETDQLRLL